MKRLRHDLNFLTSAGVLVTAVLTGITGVVADLWDLNDFWYHTLAGYVMGAFAVVHVALNWRSLVGYARFRLAPKPGAGRAAERTGPAVRPGRAPAEPLSAGGIARSLGGSVLTRRGLLGGALGAAAGWTIGRGLRPPPVIAAGSDVGVVYHQWSKPGVIDALGSVANWGQQPPLYKTYPSAPQVRLPAPRFAAGLATEEAIARRRSVRAYSGQPLDAATLSRVLMLTGGIVTSEWGAPHRAAPSSGALYPIEVYPVVHTVDGVEPGVYHYGIERHVLELVAAGDVRQRVVEQSLHQEFLGQCNAVVFLTMIMQRMRFKYQDRSYRYGLLEAGHIGENLYLAATSLGLGACGVGAFMDDDINRMLGVDGVEEAVVYMLALGNPKG
jgi:SagB-type dehydrogenase family enzyme